MDKNNNSATIQLYYKGYSMLLTDRSAGATLAELMTRSIELIEKAIKLDCKPSWNAQTNQQVTNGAGGGVLPQAERKTKPCEEHEGALLVQRIGKDNQPFWSHIIEGEFQADGKPKWCHGKKTQFTTSEYGA